jgi:hypothetical protein
MVPTPSAGKGIATAIPAEAFWLVSFKGVFKVIDLRIKLIAIYQF